MDILPPILGFYFAASLPLSPLAIFLLAFLSGSIVQGLTYKDWHKICS
ncbi:MAG: hypothetical protein M1484_00085 [Patescibacteria group bacterium]|nr:hypothetical protein [Patescibacteria group bacterium]